MELFKSLMECIIWEKIGRTILSPNWISSETKIPSFTRSQFYVLALIKEHLVPCGIDYC